VYGMSSVAELRFPAIFIVCMYVCIHMPFVCMCTSTYILSGVMTRCVFESEDGGYIFIYVRAYVCVCVRVCVCVLLTFLLSLECFFSSTSKDHFANVMPAA
jgi:hypothetical protein